MEISLDRRGLELRNNTEIISGQGFTLISFIDDVFPIFGLFFAKKQFKKAIKSAIESINNIIITSDEIPKKESFELIGILIDVEDRLLRLNKLLEHPKFKRLSKERESIKEFLDIIDEAQIVLSFNTNDDIVNEINIVRKDWEEKNMEEFTKIEL